MSYRVSKLKQKLKYSKTPDDIMFNIMEIFTKTEFIPDVGGYYTFVYFPKTNDITYDEHPLVAVTAIERWGFKAINFHWEQSRNYTWTEIVGRLHVINKDEIDYLRTLNFAKFVTK
jgi:hypothetical protein